MSSNRFIMLAVLILACALAAQASERGTIENKKTEVGAWFGSATPEVCNVPPEFGGCPSLIVMMPEFMGDGSMVATDSGSLSDHHLMGQGNWTKQHGNSGIRATFMWLQTPLGPNPAGVFRVRLLGQLDHADSDTMRGTIEPFFFPFGADGLPSPDPVAGPLPECTGLNGCLGTFQFVVRRIPTE
jgi:hypothetical protein